MGIRAAFEMRDDYLYVQGAGIFSLEDSIEVFKKALESAAFYNARRVLIDALAVEGAPTTVEYYQFGEIIAREMRDAVIAGRTQRLRIVFVANLPLLDKDHFSSVVANNRGAIVWSFDNFEDALAWLRQR